MNNKQNESAQYLANLGNLETATYNLYDLLTKKINQPENSFLISITYDTLKNTKTIESILATLDLKENGNPKKDIAELASNVTYFTKTLSKINNLDHDTIIDTLKQLQVLEEQLNKIYQTYSQSPQLIALTELFCPIQLNMKTFQKLFETLAAQKETHRQTLIDLVFCFENKEGQRQRNAAAPPLAQIRNADSKVKDATFHIIPNV